MRTFVFALSVILVAGFGSGVVDGAILDYTKAIELNPKLSQAYNNRSFARCEKKDYDGAIADAAAAVGINPKYADTCDNRAKLAEMDTQ